MFLKSEWDKLTEVAADLAQLQLGIYGTIPIAWDYSTGPAARVVWAAKKGADGVTDIVFRGSQNMNDWLCDVNALSTVNVPGMGRVHPGFYDSMQWVWQDVQARTQAPRRFSGHSLGAARATILTGLAVLDHHDPVARVCWGEPKSGFAEMAQLISIVPARSYRNSAERGSRHHDPVTDVPCFLPNFEYVHACTLTDVCVPPVGKSEWDLLAWHPMELYARSA